MDNIILLSDSYKVSHWRQYPKGTTEVYSYFESRGCDREGWHECCFFGLQYFLKRYMCGEVVTREKVDEAARLYASHFGDASLFYREGWDYIVDHCGGKLPVKIKAVPEGTVLPLKTVLMTVVNTDPNCFWLTNFLETLLVQVWYPMTVATNSRYQKLSIQQYMEATGNQDWRTPAGVGFKLHDFGFRGVSSVESATLGGLGHLVNFLGTDTVVALTGANMYYGATDAMGFSIPASEHSTITSWGVDGEVEAMRNMLEQYPTGLVACVSDSFNIFKACREYWGGELASLIKGRITEQSFGRLVVRPDSGDPTETCLAVLSILCEQFADDVTVTPTGHKLLPPYIRVIQGDGVDYESIPKILQALMDAGFAADNIGFGSGGALLQKVNRDTLKMAFKCSEIVVNGEAREVFKDPVTDNGKASKKGRLTLQLASDVEGYIEEDLYKSRDGPDGVKGGTGFLHFTPDGRYVTVASGQGDETRDLMLTVYENGELLVDQSLTEIRQRADIPNGPFVQDAAGEGDDQKIMEEDARVEQELLEAQEQAEGRVQSPQSAQEQAARGLSPQAVAAQQQVPSPGRAGSPHAAVAIEPVVSAAPQGVVYAAPPVQAAGVTSLLAPVATAAPTALTAAASMPVVTTGAVTRSIVTLPGAAMQQMPAGAPIIVGQTQAGAMVTTAPAAPVTRQLPATMAVSPAMAYKPMAGASGTLAPALSAPVVGPQVIRVQGPSFVAAPPGATVIRPMGPSFVAAPPMPTTTTAAIPPTTVQAAPQTVQAPATYTQQMPAPQPQTVVTQRAPVQLAQSVRMMPGAALSPGVKRTSGAIVMGRSPVPAGQFVVGGPSPRALAM